MEPAKYIIFDERVALIFSPTQGHSEMQLLGSMKPTSAGFCGIDALGDVRAWGHSVTLGLESDPNDTEILRRLLKRD